MSQPPTAHRRTFARINNPIMFLTTPLERHLYRYRRAGFIVSEQIAIWDPGLRSGFVNLWPEDLEIMTVGNEGAFTTGADAQLHSDRSHHGVHALELYSSDTPRLRDYLEHSGVVLPGVREGRLSSTDNTAPADFFFLDLPQLPGIRTSVMTSTFPNAAMRSFIDVAPHGVFGLAGLTIITARVEEARTAWGAVVEPGVHDLMFVTPEQWIGSHPDAPLESGIGCVHLLSENPVGTAAAMVSAGWERGPDVDGHPHLLPHPEDGVRFTIHRGSAEEWRRRRSDVLGEDLTVRRCPQRG